MMPIRGFLGNQFRYHLAEVDRELVGFVGVRELTRVLHAAYARL
jgi:hypothetical protein